MGTDFAKGFGTFLQSLGQSGMGIVQHAGQMKQAAAEKAEQAPFKKLQMDMLQQSYDKGKLGIEKEKMEIARKKAIERDMKVLQKILSKEEVQEEITKRVTEQSASPATGEIPGSTIVTQPGSSRPPTIQEQMQRLQGSGFDVSPYPEVQQQVKGVRDAYQAEQKPVLEAEKFEREQQGKIELEELKGEQRITLEQVKAGIKKTVEDQKKLNEDSEPLFKTFSVKEKENIDNINKSFLLMDNVISKINKLDEGKIKGFITQLKKDKRIFTDPETQELASAYTMLTQSLMKQIQGSRPSDYDALIFQTATGEKAFSKENMLAALKSIGSYAKANAETFINNMGKGYGIEEDRINELFHPSSQKYITGGVEAQPQTIVEIKNDEDYNKLPSGTEFIGPDGVKRRKP